MKQALTFHGTAPGPQVMVRTREHHYTAKSRSCEARTEAAYKENGNDKRYEDRNLRLCMKCVDNIQMPRSRGFHAAMNILRIRKMELAGQAGPAYFPSLRKARGKRKQSQNKPANAGVDHHGMH
jgi:hypothetical protein